MLLRSSSWVWSLMVWSHRFWSSVMRAASEASFVALSLRRRLISSCNWVVRSKEEEEEEDGVEVVVVEEEESLERRASMIFV